MATARGLTCTTTHRVIDRVLRNTTAQRTNTAMTRTTGFTEDHIFVFGVTDLTDGRETVLIHTANFAGRQTKLGITFIARH